MANPRQRRKARSGRPKARISKLANTKLKKVTPRNFPGPLSNSYNPRQTPRQNYNRLGLLSGKLAPRLSGGIEKNTDLKNIWLQKYKKEDEFEILRTTSDGELVDVEDSECSEDEEISTDNAKSEPTSLLASIQDKKLSKGEGRIIRDANGKIIKVVIGDEAEIELEPTSEDPAKIVINHTQKSTTSTPWGNPLQKPSYEQDPADIKTPSVPVLQGIGYQNPRQGVVPPKTKFVEELEKISSQRMMSHAEIMKNKQHLSENQINWLTKLIQKYGLDNTHLMARDLKLNKYQKTEGEIRHLISKLASQS